MSMNLLRTRKISQAESDRQRDLMYNQQIQAIEAGAAIIRESLPIEIDYRQGLVRIGNHQYSVETCLDAIEG